MSKIIRIMLLICFGLIVVAGNAEESSYQEDYFETQIRQHCRAGMGISSGIIENISNSTWGCMDFQITKAIADEKEFMVEIVVRLNDPDSEIRYWEEGPRWMPVTELEENDQHTIYYINADYSESCNAWDGYEFNEGVCFILFGSTLDTKDGITSKEIVVTVGIVNKDSRQIEEIVLPVTYQLRPLYDYCSYDLSKEPITDEICITKLEFAMTILREYDVFQYEPVSKDYHAELDYDKPRISIPEDPIQLKIYEKGKLIKIIEFVRDNEKLIPWRYWTPQMYE